MELISAVIGCSTDHDCPKGNCVDRMCMCPIGVTAPPECLPSYDIATGRCIVKDGCPCDKKMGKSS
jgi:hypothetical protein